MSRAVLLFVVAAAGCTLAHDVDDLDRGPVAMTPSPRCGRLPGCGPEGDCCASYVVPAASFMMGRGNADDWTPADDDETPEHPRRVSRFALDAFEVTVARWRGFVGEYEAFIRGLRPGDGAHPRVADSGWDPTWAAEVPSSRAELEVESRKCGLAATWTPMAGANETRPLNCVTWYLALLFCAWDGGHLPTEAEWELAAAGPSNRRFPWGDDETAAGAGCARDGDPACAIADVPHAGTAPEARARFGHHDLGGGLSEWVLDTYRARFYSEVAPGCVDCASLAPGEGLRRVVRGASFESMDPGARRSAARFSLPPDNISHATGFRCARPASAPR